MVSIYRFRRKYDLIMHVLYISRGSALNECSALLPYRPAAQLLAAYDDMFSANSDIDVGIALRIDFND